MADIFLSYNEKDRDTVRRLAETLKSVGWSVWWDRRIPAGGTWRQLLERELAAMRCMVVVWSSNSVKSEWVCEEATEGRQLGKLVPVCIEAVKPPAGFREIQAADLVGWDGTATFVGMRTLIEDIQLRIGAPVVTRSRRSKKFRRSSFRRRSRSLAKRQPFLRPPDRASTRFLPRDHDPRLAMIAGIVGTLLVAIVLYAAFGRSDPRQPDGVKPASEAEPAAMAPATPARRD